MATISTTTIQGPMNIRNFARISFEKTMEQLQKRFDHECTVVDDSQQTFTFFFIILRCRYRLLSRDHTLHVNDIRCNTFFNIMTVSREKSEVVTISTLCSRDGVLPIIVDCKSIFQGERTQDVKVTTSELTSIFVTVIDNHRNTRHSFSSIRSS